MLIEDSIKIKNHPRNHKLYISKGYDIIDGFFDVHIKDVSGKCTSVVACLCDNCGRERNIEYRAYFKYTGGCVNPYYCSSCKNIRYAKNSIEKHGVDNPMKLDKFKTKLKKSLIKTYGVDHYSKTDEYKAKYKQTCLDKYGVDNVSKLDKIKEKISRVKTENFNSIDRYEELISDDYEMISYDDREFKILHKNCSNEFNIFIVTLSDRIKGNNILCTCCNPIDNSKSSGEIEVKDFLRENNIEFIENTYSLISPLSLDIYIPSINLAIEYNGVYWHSEVYRHKKYHYNKTKMCEEVGIELIHIWEDDWNSKKDIVKSILLNRIGKSTKIWARKCDIRVIDDVKLVRKFLDENHIQGFVGSKVKLGLFYNNELVSLMCFGKKRKEIELVRFCNLLNTTVVGSASKLFKYFINNYEYDFIDSFSDTSMFNGGLYDKLGFEFEHETPINYSWVVGGVRKHRFNFSKAKLVKQGFDSNRSECEIMHSRKYYRIWGCGLKKWRYK